MNLKRRELLSSIHQQGSSSLYELSSRDLLWRRGGFRMEWLKRKKSIGISWKDNNGGLEEREEGWSRHSVGVKRRQTEWEKVTDQTEGEWGYRGLKQGKVTREWQAPLFTVCQRAGASHNKIHLAYPLSTWLHMWFPWSSYFYVWRQSQDKAQVGEEEHWPLAVQLLGKSQHDRRTVLELAALLN